MAEASRPWYKKWWGMVLAIAFWPYFLVWYAWSKSKWGTGGKAVATILGGSVAMVSFAAAANPSSPSSLSTPTPRLLVAQAATSTPAPTARLAATPSPLPTLAPTQTPATSAPHSAEFVAIKSATSPINAGAYATLNATTLPNSACSVEVDYKSGPSHAQGLYDHSANSAGAVSWTWKVGTNTTPGAWPIHVACTLNGESASADTSIGVN